VMCYKKVPPNQVLCVYGRSLAFQNMQKTYTGGGCCVWPILQSCSWMSLTPMPLEVSLKGALSLEKIRLDVPSVFTVAIGKEDKILEAASVRLLNLTREEIRLQAEEIILGQLRQVVATLTIEEINQDRQKFMDEITSHCSSELGKVGLELLNVNITNIEDHDGVIKAMGRNASSKAVEKANVEVAIAEKNGAIGVNREKTEKESTNAVLDKDRQVAVQEAKTTESIQIAELRAKQLQGENMSLVTMAQSDSSRRIQEAQARQEYAIKDQSVLEAEALAAAQAQEAIAKRVEMEKRVELEAPAKAQKAELIVQAEAQAEQRRVSAKAEADAIFVIAEAQARGEYEMLSRKATGLGEICKSTGSSQAAFQLMMLEHLDKLAETSATAVSNIKFDKIVVWDGGGGGTDGKSSATSNFVRSLAGSLPPTFDILREVAGVDMPQYFGSLPGSAKQKQDAEKSSESNVE